MSRSELPMHSLVLNVDDDDGARYARGRYLRQAGFTVRDAGTGRAALEMMSERPDIVVLDLHLPDMDGFDVCRRIKSDEATASTPVLHVSAVFVDAEARARALDGGADGYLAEPVLPEVLVAAVRSLLSARDTAVRPRLLDGVRVLALDDSPDAVELSQVVLGQHGAEVRGAECATDALALIAGWLPHVIIADIAMPDEDGYHFLERVRELPANAGGRTPAIAWTGHVTEEHRLRSLRVGYQVHMSKPVPAEDLIRVVARLTGRG
jgi:CheY-like chemotaxis protein